jgi:cation transporter-like permease
LSSANSAAERLACRTSVSHRGGSKKDRKSSELKLRKQVSSLTPPIALLVNGYHQVRADVTGVADAHEAIIMEWTPIAFGTFKALALGIGMYYAVKWHYDQEDKAERGTLLRTGGMIAAAFILALVIVGSIAFVLSSMLGLDLSLP